MRIPLTFLFATLLVVSVARTAFAQASLDRVERQVRKQLDEPQDEPAEGAATRAKAEAGYLGISADDRQAPGRGVVILGVASAGPAATAGLRTGDVITQIDGREIRQMADMTRALANQAAGAKVAFQATRSGESRKFDVTLGSRPAALSPPSLLKGSSDAVVSPKLGIHAEPVSPEVQRQSNLPTTDGVLIGSVTAGSPAALARLPVGGVITAINGQPIKTPDELASAVQRAGFGSQIELTYFYRGGQMRQKLTLPMRPGLTSLTPAPKTRQLDPSADDLVAKPPSNPQNLARLEQRIRDLEQRVEKLESALRAKDNR